MPVIFLRVTVCSEFQQLFLFCVKFFLSYCTLIQQLFIGGKQFKRIDTYRVIILCFFNCFFRCCGAAGEIQPKREENEAERIIQCINAFILIRYFHTNIRIPIKHTNR